MLIALKINVSFNAKVYQQYPERHQFSLLPPKVFLNRSSEKVETYNGHFNPPHSFTDWIGYSPAQGCIPNDNLEVVDYKR